MAIKLWSGVVCRSKCDKTIIVKVWTKYRHPRYGKVIRRFKTYTVHDERNYYKDSDVVSFASCGRRLSKTKSWIVLYNENIEQRDEV